MMNYQQTHPEHLFDAVECEGFFLSRKVCRSLSGLDPMPWHGVPVPVPWSCSWQMTLKPSSAQVELWIGCYGRACVEKTSRDEVGPSCIFFFGGGLIHISFFHNDIYTYNIYTYFITYIQAYYSSHIYIYIDACCLPWVSLWLRLALLVQRSDSFDPAMAVFLSLRAWYSKRTGRLAAQFRREDSYLENILMCIGLCWFIFIHLIYVDVSFFLGNEEMDSDYTSNPLPLFQPQHLNCVANLKWNSVQP